MLRKLVSVILSVIIISTSFSFAGERNFTNFKEMQRYVQTEGIFVSNELEQLDFKAVKEPVIGMLEVREVFPEIKPYISGIFAHDVSFLMAASPSGNIFFSEHYFSSYKRITRNTDWTTGVHPKNTGIKSVGHHEMGHIIELCIIDNTSDMDKITDWNSHYTTGNIIKEAVRRLKEKPEYKNMSKREIIRTISSYANTNDSEALAEAISDYFINGESCSDISKEIMDEVFNIFKNMRKEKMKGEGNEY